MGYFMNSIIRSRWHDRGAIAANAVNTDGRAPTTAAALARKAACGSALLLIVATGACTTVPKDLGRGEIDSAVNERGLPVETQYVENPLPLVSALTAKPLTAESAVRIALVNNPQIKASYARLGFSAADIYAAGRIRNPVFSVSYLDSNRSGERDRLTLGLLASFTDLITLSARKRLAAVEFAQMKQAIGAEVVNLAADTEAAFYRFIAAKQVVALSGQIAHAGQLSAALAQRYYDAGNVAARAVALEHANAAELRLVALAAEAEAYRVRTELATLMGVPVSDAWDAAAQLPLPLEQDDDPDQLLALARGSRLDLAAAQARAQAAASRLGIADWQRWLGELNVGAEHERETDGARLNGPTANWELPLFNQGRDALLRAQAELRIAIADVERLNLKVGNDTRLAYAAMQNAKAKVVEYQQRLIPARIAAVARGQEEENFMLIGVFELLALKRQEYNAYQGYLEAVRDYWLTRAELTRAVGNSLPSSVRIGEDYVDVEQYLRPRIEDEHPSDGMMHNHSMAAPDGKGDAESMSIDHSRHRKEGDTPVDGKAVPNNILEHHNHGVHPDIDGGSR